MQIESWLQRHGLGRSVGHLCPRCRCGHLRRHAPCDRHAFLACELWHHQPSRSRCPFKESCRGEFFARYQDLPEALGILYMTCRGFSPALQRSELGVRKGHRIADMLEHLGPVAREHLLLLFKSKIGRCWYMQVDEAYAGKRKFKLRRGRRVRR